MNAGTDSRIDCRGFVGAKSLSKVMLNDRVSGLLKVKITKPCREKEEHSHPGWASTPMMVSTGHYRLREALSWHMHGLLGTDVPTLVGPTTGPSESAEVLM